MGKEKSARHRRHRTTNTQNIDFGAIRFGFADAQQEALYEPELLTEAFFDPSDIPKKLIDFHQWLVLGYKGAGKTAVAEHLYLKYTHDPIIHVRILNLHHFEYRFLTQVANYDAAEQNRLSASWNWTFLIEIMRRFLDDESAQRIDGGSMAQIREALAFFGVDEKSDITQLVQKSAELNARLQIPQFLEIVGKKTFERNNAPLSSFLPHLKAIVASLRSNCRHFIILDGLDSVLTDDRIQYLAISQLLLEVSMINVYLQRNGVPVKIIILLRTDIFETLASANKNKIRQDNSVELEWRGDPRKPRESRLSKLANLRASFSLGKRVDLFQDCFPKSFANQNFAKYCLEMTRHTPRDYLQLMTKIQENARSGNVNNNQLKNSFRDYSVSYILPEIQDELHGYAEKEEVKEIINAIGLIRARDFSKDQLIAKLGGSHTIKDLDSLLHALFECSAIGNVRWVEGMGRSFLVFRYRNRYAPLRHDERLIVHRALWRGFNLALNPIGENVEEYEHAAADWIT